MAITYDQWKSQYQGKVNPATGNVWQYGDVAQATGMNPADIERFGLGAQQTHWNEMVGGGEAFAGQPLWKDPYAGGSAYLDINHSTGSTSGYVNPTTWSQQQVKPAWTPNVNPQWNPPAATQNQQTPPAANPWSQVNWGAPAPTSNAPAQPAPPPSTPSNLSGPGLSEAPSTNVLSGSQPGQSGTTMPVGYPEWAMGRTPSYQNWAQGYNLPRPFQATDQAWSDPWAMAQWVAQTYPDNADVQNSLLNWYGAYMSYMYPGWQMPNMGSWTSTPNVTWGKNYTQYASPQENIKSWNQPAAPLPKYPFDAPDAAWASPYSMQDWIMKTYPNNPEMGVYLWGKYKEFAKIP